MKSMSWRCALIGAAIIVAAGLVYGASRPLPSPARAKTAPDAIEDAWTGKFAPDFALRSLDGKRIRLSQFRGKTVLVNFWATWCAPCRVDMPWLADFYNRYAGRNFEIIGIAMDDGDRDKVAEFVRDTHVGYTVLLKNDDIGPAYGGARFLPQSFFVGPDGRILAHTIGIRSKDSIRADIMAAIERGARAKDTRS